MRAGVIMANIEVLFRRAIFYEILKMQPVGVERIVNALFNWRSVYGGNLDDEIVSILIELENNEMVSFDGDCYRTLSI